MTVLPSIMLEANSVRWWIVTGATVPCWDSAIAASAVMRARGVAPLSTKTSDLSRFSTRSTVAPAARRSCGLGRVGMTTRSQTRMTCAMVAVIAGGVSKIRIWMPMSRIFCKSWTRRDMKVCAKTGVCA